MVTHFFRFETPLETRIEYLTLAVGNAKSHPVSGNGQYESAISFLTDLEEKLDVAQVQLELYNLLFPRINEPGEWGAKIKLLSKGLYNVTQVCLPPATLSISVNTHLLSAVPRVCRTIEPPHHEATDLPRLGTSR